MGIMIIRWWYKCKHNYITYIHIYSLIITLLSAFVYSSGIQVNGRWHRALNVRVIPFFLLSSIPSSYYRISLPLSLSPTPSLLLPLLSLVLVTNSRLRAVTFPSPPSPQRSSHHYNDSNVKKCYVHPPHYVVRLFMVHYL